MGASSNKGGMGGPNTAGPGGQGRDYAGNAIGSNMPGEFNIGGPRAQGGAYGQPIFGQPPAQDDLYQPGGNRFMPGRGMVPPAGGRIGNPRQVNPGQGPMQPGMPPRGNLYPMPSPGGGGLGIADYPQPRPGGGGKGGMPGPGGPQGQVFNTEYRNY